MRASAVRGLTAALVGAVACAACGGSAPCHAASKVPTGCPDLTFEGRPYREWRVVHPRGILQEVGDAFYPACNKADRCGGDPLDGKGSTDVWRYGDLDFTKAVIGLREDTHTYVVFVRVGIDPATLASQAQDRGLSRSQGLIEWRG